MARPPGPQNPVDLASPLRYVRGIGPSRAKALAAKGYETAGDLLLHFPFRYEDRSQFSTIESLQPGMGRVSISGTILGCKLFSTRRRGLRIIRAVVDDGTSAVECLWFNQPFIKDHLKEGTEIIIYGVPVYASKRKSVVQFSSPDWEIITRERGDEIHMGRIVPVHRRLPGLSPKALRRAIHDILASLPEKMPDPIPAALRKRLVLSPRAESFRQVHFPDPDVGMDLLADRKTPFHRRMIFEELFMLQVALALVRQEASMIKRINKYKLTPEIRNRLRNVLPFPLMGAQKQVLQEIADDLKSTRPMHRLIQGDVGSGKTIVAILSMLMAIENGYQTALMAPTELLAEQHFRKISHLLGERGYRPVLLTGASKGTARKQILAGIAGGFWNLVVGTHALIQDKVRFQKLGLIVVDEQHRFGVLQRAALTSKGTQPDVLIMTATPIPRSLCMTVYGDLDLSIIDEMPPGRRPIKTARRQANSRAKIYEFVRRQIRKGRQAYVVLPLVEESEKSDLKAAVNMAGELTRLLPDTSVGLIHGKMAPEDREVIMQRFAAGEVELLVSTTVIEVGIDVPNATIMMIENAERFGLSQLHQLRGRVGRGEHQSYCILMESEKLTSEAEERLQIMAATQDGFKISEKDLEIRGPGELTGTRQTGLPELRIANIVRDRELLELARKEAFRLVGRGTSAASQQGREARSLVEHVRSRWGARLGLAGTG